MPGDPAKSLLASLRALYRRERATTVRRFAEERAGLSLDERVAKGLALRDLEVEETDAAAGGRVVAWLALPKGTDLDDLRVRTGDPVRLWWSDPNGPEAALGIVRRRGDGLGVVLDSDAPDRIFEGGFHLDRDAPQTTFERADRALAWFEAAARGSDGERLADVLFGDRVPAFAKSVERGAFFDDALEDAQRDAVALALAAEDVALVHGPPGTGKTRTLVEVVRQAVARGERVLVTAASNTAVDNLAERLVLAGVQIVRVGHPARVADAVEARSLDALTQATEEWRLARRWTQEADALRARVDRRTERGTLHRGARREALAEAFRLSKDARRQLLGVQQRILARAPVVCATASGADTRILEGLAFDRVVLDEATQAPDPIAAIALARAPRAVLAGDPRQLPPTVIDVEAAREGLGTTLFERLAERRPAAVRMLEVQHRMHEDLMAFPSAALYDGRLRAHPSVARQRLEELPGVVADPTRDAPLVFVDTAGTGFDEQRAADDPSTRNPEMAARVAREARRLLRRGLAPRDLAVITPYEAEARLLRAHLADARAAGLEIGTVDGFQGREKEAVVVDLVRSNADGDLGFLADVRRMNVALTRARRALVVVGDGATLGGHPFYAAFLDAVAKHGRWVSAFEDDPEAELPDGG